jgi:hypothetical protein
MQIFEFEKILGHMKKLNQPHQGFLPDSEAHFEKIINALSCSFSRILKGSTSFEIWKKKKLSEINCFLKRLEEFFLLK